MNGLLERKGQEVRGTGIKTVNLENRKNGRDHHTGSIERRSGNFTGI